MTILSGQVAPIEKESGFLTNAGQEAVLDVTYRSPSIKRVVVRLDPTTSTYTMRAVLKPKKVSGAVVLTVDAPSITVGDTTYEALQASQRFTITSRARR